MKRMQIGLAATLLLWAASGRADGHGAHTRLLWQTLPAELREFLAPAEKIFMANCGYPDNMRSFTAEGSQPHAFGDDWREVLAEDFALLIAQECTTPYSLHSDRGKGTALMLITRAFREKHPGRAALMENGQARHLFLPQYLFFPYLLSPERSIGNPAEPTLDSFGVKVLHAALRLVVPSLPPTTVQQDGDMEAGEGEHRP